MGFLSFLQRRSSASPAASSSGDEDIAAARTRARRRLIGATVLVLCGVIGFPLVFETQPRPIPVDIPIEIPRKDAVPALALPAPRKPPAASAPERAPREPIITETTAEAGREVAAARPASAAPPAEPPKKVAAAKPAASAQDSARAKALLEGRDASASAAAAASKADTPTDGAGRFVVQVGAFSDASSAREVRGKVDKLGLKTYTQVVETSSGSRIRVRAGPFGSREEADKALAKAKAAGLNAVVLTL